MTAFRQTGTNAWRGCRLQWQPTLTAHPDSVVITLQDPPAPPTGDAPPKFMFAARMRRL